LNWSRAAQLARRFAPALGMLGIVLFIYAPVLPAGRTLWYRDIYGFWVALADDFVRVVASGAPPLWNPYLGFGMPMLADPGTQVLYPFTWLNLVLPPATFYKAYALSHALLSGLGLFGLARRQGIEARAAFIAALAWVASGPFQELLGHTHHFAGAAWLPWVILALDRTLTLPTLRAGLALGAVAAVQVLAGSGDMCLMTAFIACGWTGYRLLGPQAGPRGRALAAAALIGAPLAALLSAVQWLPTLDLLRSGMRLGMSAEGHTYWSLHPASLIELLVPNALSGLPIGEALRGTLYESREPLYACLYLGAPAVVLVSLGLLRSSRLAAFCSGAFAAALVVALGKYTPLYGWLAQVTPLSILRYPTKYTIAAAFFWSLLVASGAQAWLAGECTPPRRRAALAAGGILALLLLAAALAITVHPEPLRALLVADAAARLSAPRELACKLALGAGLVGLTSLALARVRPASPWALLPLVLVGGDLLRVAQGVNVPAPRELLGYTPDVATRLPDGARVYVSMAHGRDWLPQQVVRAPAGWARAWAIARARTDLLWPPLAGRYGFRGSFDGNFTGLAAPLVSNLALIVSGAEGTPVALRLLQVTGVDYVLTADENPWPGLEAQWTLDSTLKGAVRVLRVPATRPRFLLVGRSRVLPDPDSVYALVEAGFDPARETVLSSGPVLDGLDFSGAAQELQRRADRLEVATTSSAPGLLVVLDSDHAGWRASVDGQAAPILRADVLFKAVAVPAGRHVVELRYLPASVAFGALASATGLALGLLAAWLGRSRAVERTMPAL
jgi:hypothetical protein